MMTFSDYVAKIYHMAKEYGVLRASSAENGWLLSFGNDRYIYLQPRIIYNQPEDNIFFVEILWRKKLMAVSSTRVLEHMLYSTRHGNSPFGCFYTKATEPCTFPDLHGVDYTMLSLDCVEIFPRTAYEAKVTQRKLFGDDDYSVFFDVTTASPSHLKAAFSTIGGVVAWADFMKMARMATIPKEMGVRFSYIEGCETGLYA